MNQVNIIFNQFIIYLSHSLVNHCMLIDPKVVVSSYTRNNTMFYVTY